MAIRSLERWLRYGCVAVVAVVSATAHAREHVVLKNGFEMDCVRREPVGDRVRLYLAGADNYVEVASDAVVRVEQVADAPVVSENAAAGNVTAGGAMPVINDAPTLTGEEMHTMLAHAGTEHNIDEDLLASLVKAESGGQVHAVSRTGARGLMQLMPYTATELGVKDSFRPEENIAGGSAYLDQLLTRYHDNVALALAAYNAGPRAVDRYRGIPPYRETQAYVARVIREFNRRKQAVRVANQMVASGGHVVAHAAQAR